MPADKSLLDARRGRSTVATRFVFNRQAYTDTVKPTAAPKFVEALNGAFNRLQWNENFDMVFRGEVRSLSSSSIYSSLSFRSSNVTYPHPHSMNSRPLTAN
jgi:hypothetical protein